MMNFFPPKIFEKKIEAEKILKISLAKEIEKGIIMKI